MIKELEEVRDALVHAQDAIPPSVTLNIVEQALTTLDRIIKQDKAEMVEKVELEIASVFVADMVVTMEERNKFNAAAKAALRAVGMIEEGE